MNHDVLFLLFWVPDGKALGILMGSTQAMGIGIVRILGSGRVALNSAHTQVFKHSLIFLLSRTEKVQRTPNKDKNDE